MISREENELLTQTGPGTPCGDLIRRYWQPAALSEECPPGGAPLPVRLLGEDLVLFRDDQGRPGLLDIHCPHRGADLSYGRLEDGGVRCIYHGWLFDVRGHCLDQPGEAGGGEHKDSIHLKAYPCEERAGVVFAYLGPGAPPLLPNYEFLIVPEEQRTVSKIFYECNYLQGNEGNIDPVHLSFLHRNLQDTERDKSRPVSGGSESANTLLGKDTAPTIELEITSFGIRIYSVRKAGPDQHYLRVTNFILPNLAAFGGATGNQGYSVNWHVPINDTQHWRYAFVFRRNGPLDLSGRTAVEKSPDYKSIRDKTNRYLQDRSSMKAMSFSGLGYNFADQDRCVIEGAGLIQDRSQEMVVSSDKAIVTARKLLLNAIKEIQAGRDAPHVVRTPELNRFPQIAVINEVIPATTDWREHTRKAESRVTVYGDIEQLQEGSR